MEFFDLKLFFFLLITQRFSFLPDRLCYRSVRVGAPRTGGSRGRGPQTHARVPRTTNGKRARHLVAETRQANIGSVTASLAAATKRHATPIRRGRRHRGRGGRYRHRSPIVSCHVPAELHAGGTAAARGDARTAVDAGAKRTGATLARMAVPGPRDRRGAVGRRYRRARVRAADHREHAGQVRGHRVVRPVRGLRGATVAHVLHGQAPGVPDVLH